MVRPRILLADDHPSIREKVTRMLESEFDIIETVTNGQALLDEAVVLEPDIVVLDITMPGLPGIEVAHRLRKAGSHAKIVFLTVHEDPNFIREALATGALGYVVKPRLASDPCWGCPPRKQILIIRRSYTPAGCLQEAS